ncbi:hypothetical protein BpHYR1_041089 [Brachionus plicatilis]|uniref:Uncharacterized protein n=1 Tax=Brachionus plicatilis TaxID=10195 RepID=A0A3M7R615_BRAPC|nr:hypothetical protein BpHYR1_041089 [Brachionus plicatilis]
MKKIFLKKFEPIEPTNLYFEEASYFDKFSMSLFYTKDQSISVLCALPPIELQFIEISKIML